MQITLGLLCGVLGGLLYLCPYFYLRDTGAAFWTGAVVSGVKGVSQAQEAREG